MLPRYVTNLAKDPELGVGSIGGHAQPTPHAVTATGLRPGTPIGRLAATRRRTPPRERQRTDWGINRVKDWLDGPDVNNRVNREFRPNKPTCFR